MNAVVEKAMISEAAREAAMRGWSLDEIRNAVCVECGEIHLPYPTGVEGLSVKGGRKIGYRKNGTRYDAGYICGDCMK